MTAAPAMDVERNVTDRGKDNTDAGDNVKMSDNVATATEDALPNTRANAVTPSKKPKEEEAQVFSPELLKMYYARLFPYSLLCNWLSYDPSFGANNKSDNKPNVNGRKKIFSRREFSFTLEPMPGEEIYIRYQSFSDLEGLRSAINRRQPRKIDIGAVFSHPPKDKNAYGGGGSGDGKNSGFRPVQRELVFDIDLTDYDDVRRCGCSGAQICRTCWTFMAAALKILDRGLREDFGFEHIAWFYSGRRGIHAWVCDESARNLSDEARSAVANYFEVSLNKKNGGGVLGSNNKSGAIHPMLTRSYDVLEPYFCRYVLPGGDTDDDDSAIGGHGLLASRDVWEELVLDTLPPGARETVGENLKNKWSNPRQAADLTPVEKWHTLLAHLRVRFDFPPSWPSPSCPSAASEERDEPSNKRKRPAKFVPFSSMSDEQRKIYVWPMEFVFKYTYPRLDINVSKMRNHLLKSPFCVHPKTGRVCVPIDPDAMDAHHPSGGFDPFAVPTLARLAGELDEYHKQREDDDEAMDDASNDKSAPQHDWQKTSLKKYFNVFEKSFLEPLQRDWRLKERDSAEREAAMRGDF
eukprot:CAMPEP_0197182234 /NCGR_PEP_ID=MMETSP1423-20130617/6263_1 /TAXON_ID=476441 /ORGANISM="Pseudo-nitzschia heimii, Strain UNC1101" /LENGTH=577 /DNA_ID=CAMNT_0042632623 /DNA_START=72 /DNA_END=1805 /DNA_ORIENTATION=+